MKVRFMLLYHTVLGDTLVLKLGFLDKNETVLDDIALYTTPVSHWTLNVDFWGEEPKGYVDTHYFTFTVDPEKALDNIAYIVKDCVVIAEWEEVLDED